MKKYLLLSILLIATPNVLAANIGFIIPGSKLGSISGIVTAANLDTFSTRLLPDRSVYCRYRSNAISDWGLSSTLTCPFLTACPTARLVGDAESGIDAQFGPDDAIAFITDEQIGAALSNYKYDITISTVSGSIIPECFETTLYGNFNTVTAANPFNFLELSNDSAISITTRILVTKNDGTLLSRTNITVSAGQQIDIPIHDIAGAANTFGRVTVAHDGALHGLRAKITKYTSSLLITASDKFETRGNEE